MCLLVPGKIVKIDGDRAVIDYGVEQRAGKIVEKGFELGDYVLVQGGIVMVKVDEKEALESLKLYKKAVNS
ncbi:MAG: HypC/HybG/HupF family hydrogenase formation chaperone [Candidatus Woesearchaeota archaeon]